VVNHSIGSDQIIFASRAKRFGTIPSAIRQYRQSRGFNLHDVARVSGINAARASVIEREPEKARPGEIGRLRDAIDRLTEIAAKVAS